MTLGLFPQEESNALDMAARSPFGTTPAPSATAGMAGAAASGVGEGLEDIRQTAETGVSSLFSEGLRNFSAIDEFTPRAPAAVAVDPDVIQHDRAVATKAALDYYRPNPAVVGSAAQTVHNVVAGVTPFLVGSLVGNPEIGAVTAGVTQGTNTREELMANGVDTKTADILGAANAALAYGGAKLPMGLGETTVQHIASGAAIQELAGLTNRTMMHTVLDDAGYKDMANQYRTFDLQAMAADAIVGSIQGQVWHSVFAPSVQDAARVVRDQHQIESSASGVPINQVERELHITQEEDSVRALMDGQPVMDKTFPDTVPNPAQNAERGAAISETANAAAEPLAEALGSAQERTATLGMADYPFYEMTAQELQAHAENSAALIKQHEDAILGDRVDEWRKAQRLSNSSNDATAKRGEDTIHDIESRLAPEDQATLYGSPGGKLHADAYDDVVDFREGISFGTIENADEAVQVMKYQLGKLNNVRGDDPAKWTREQQVAYATARAVNDSIRARGLDSEAISNRAIREAAKRYGDPVDAEAMLFKFPRNREGPRRKSLTPPSR